jgi:hypothetical protein
VAEDIEARGASKSSASRALIDMTTEKLAAFLDCRLDDIELIAMMLDGIEFAEQTVIVALGVTTDGTKVPLGLWTGSTENHVVAGELLHNLIERGLRIEQPLLCVIDGGKGIHKALRQVLGDRAVIQRCQVHYPESIVIWSRGRSALEFPALRRGRRLITTALQGREEREQMWRRTPATLRTFDETSTSPEGVEDIAFHLDVRADVPAGGRDARMAKVVADHGNIDASLQERDGTAVAKHVRCHATTLEERDLSCGERDVLLQDVCGPVASECSAARAAEDRVGPQAPGRRRESAIQGSRSLGPKRTDALLVAFSSQTNVTRRSKVEVRGRDGQGFADASAGVVEEDQQRVVAHAGSRPTIGLSQDRSHVLRLKVLDGAAPGLLSAHGEDALVLRGSRHVVAQEVLDESAHGSQPAVAGSRGILPGRFEIVEEGQDALDVDVVEAQGGYGATTSQKEKEETQRVPVRAHRVGARAANAAQMIADVRLDESEELVSRTP